MENECLIKEISDYCAKSGISPSTLGVRVLGNSRFFDRLKRRIQKTDEDVAKLRAFMAENPPDAEKKGAA